MQYDNSGAGRRVSGVLLAGALMAVGQGAGAVDSAQDTDIGIDPLVRYFGSITPGTESSPLKYRVKYSGAGSVTLSNAVLGGANATEYRLATDNCSGAVLDTATTECDMEVVFAPTTRGARSVTLEIDTTDADTPVLTAFATNHEDLAHEASRRTPPVLYDLDVPEQMVAGQSYTVTWSMLGYHEGYIAYLLMFDCTGESNCGAGGGDPSRFLFSDKLSPVGQEVGDWTYQGMDSTIYHYSYDFTVPATRADGSPWAAGGTDVVLRFYRKSTADDAANNPALSLLIPGKLSDRYFDASGRRIIKTIVP